MPERRLFLKQQIDKHFSAHSRYYAFNIQRHNLFCRLTCKRHAFQPLQYVRISIAHLEVVTGERSTCYDIVLYRHAQRYLPHSFKSSAAHNGMFRVVPVEEFRCQIFLFALFYTSHILMSKRYCVMTERAAYVLHNLADRHRRMVFQQCDALADALHAFARQFLSIWCYAVHHMLHVRIAEHCSVHNAAPGYMVERIARYLAAADEHIVASRRLSLYAHTVQNKHKHIDITVECHANVLITCYVTHHYIAPVRIDTAASALPSVHLYAVVAAVGGVHLIGHKLVAAYDDRRVSLPHEETVVCIDRMCHMLFHCEVERQAAGSIVG